MTPKNVDETIQKTLQTYARHCKRILDKDKKRIENGKYKSDKEYKDAKDDYNSAIKAYEFLLKIAENPKNYLYSGKDIFHAKDPEDGKSLYNKLSPILAVRFDRSREGCFICKLSECIQNHVTYHKANNDSNGKWICWDENADLEAKKIFALNLTVKLWDGNDIINSLKSILPARVYAVDAYKTAEKSK